MKLLVNKIYRISGIVTPPASKSQTIRALFFACLARGSSTLVNPLDSDDTQDAIRVCEAFGTKVSQSNNSIMIQSQGIPMVFNETKINTGNSGITTRFLLPVLGLKNSPNDAIVVDCGEQMKQRPLSSLLDALKALGLKIECLEKEGTCPVKISGELRGGKTEVNGLTSQFISALLISLPLAKIDSEITVENLHERPYLEMTLSWLKELGIKFDHAKEDKKDIFKIPCGQHYRSFQKQIPADFSSLSYPLATAVLILGEVRLQGIDMSDAQGDKRLISILQAMGADIQINGFEILIRGGKPLRGLTIDANDIPDMVPTLAVVATQAVGETRIVNVAQARAKETDRLHSMAVELKKMGAKIEELLDGLIINQSNLIGTNVHGYNDHRTVMALSIAGLLATGQTQIDTAEATSKTFPNFTELMNELGAGMKISN